MLLLRSAVAAASLLVVAPQTALGLDLTALSTVVSGVDVPAALMGDSLTLAASPDGANVYAASGGADAILVFERGPLSGGLSLVDSEQDGVGAADGLAGARDVIVSPDGEHVYVAGRDDGAIAVFARDPFSGALDFLEVEKDGVGGVTGLAAPNDVALSPGGEHLYAVSSGSIAAFSRGADGRLSFVESLSEAADGIDGLAIAESVLVSPDGRHVYVAARGEGGKIAIFSRNGGSGALTFAGIFASGDGGSSSLDLMRQLTATRDGRFLYAAASLLVWFSRDADTGLLSFLAETGTLGLTAAFALSRDDSQLSVASVDVGGQFCPVLSAFDRNAVTGDLSFDSRFFCQGARGGSTTGDNVLWIEDHLYEAGNPVNGSSTVIAMQVIEPFEYREHEADGANGATALDGATAAGVSGDGAHVYVAARSENAIQVLARDATSGDLDPLSAVRDGSGGVDGLSGVADLAATSDGKHLYAVAATDDSVAAFARNASTGALTFVEIEKDGVGGVTALNGANGVVVSPNGAHVYAIAAGDSAIASFSRNPLSGALTLVDQDAGLSQLSLVADLAISPDGAHLYTAAPYEQRVGIFGRNASTGAVTPLPPFDLGATSVAGLSAVAVSPDGRSVYATESFASTVLAFARDPADGSLELLDQYSGPSGSWPGVTVTPDGRFVVLPSSGTPDVLQVYRRDGDSGRLAYGGAVHTSMIPGDLEAVAISPDGRNLYATSRNGDAVAVFAPEPGDAALAMTAIGALATLTRRRR